MSILIEHLHFGMRWVDMISKFPFFSDNFHFMQVYKATRGNRKDPKEVKLWDDANKWLAERR